MYQSLRMMFTHITQKSTDDNENHLLYVFNLWWKCSLLKNLGQLPTYELWYLNVLNIYIKYSKFCCLLTITVLTIPPASASGEFSNSSRHSLASLMNWSATPSLVWRRVTQRWMLENKFPINRLINLCIADTVIVPVNIPCSS